MRKFLTAACALAILAAAQEPANAAATKLTLGEAVARAYENHPDMASAAARLRKAQLTVEDLQNQRVGVTAEVAANLLSNQSPFFPPNEAPLPATWRDPLPLAGGTVALTVPLFTGWKISESAKAADLGETAAKAEQDGSRVALTLEVVRAFWGLRQAELERDIQRQNLAQAERARDLAVAGKAAGRQSDRDIDQAESSVMSAQSQVLQTEGGVLSAKIQLASILGLAAADFELLGDPPAVPAQVALPVAADIDAALNRRPDYRAAQARALQAAAGVKASQGDYWPQVAFRTSYEHGNNQQNPATGIRNTDRWAGQWDALVNVKYNLFDMGKVKRGVERDQQDLAEAEAALEKLQRRVRADIESAAVRAGSAAARARISEKAVELAQRNYDWALARKQQGYGLAIEVDDARTKLAVARSQRVGARIDYVTAQAELQAALGTL